MKVFDLLLALVICMVWGFNFIAAKVGVEQFPPVWFTGMRFAVVASLLLPFLRWHAGSMKLVLAVALFAGALHFSMMFTGLKLADDISTVAILTQLNVPFATILAVVLLNERIGWRRIAGIVAAFSGVMVMGFDPRVFGYIEAVVLIVVSGFAMALAQILMRRLKGVGVFSLQAWIGLTAAPALLLLSLPIEQAQTQAMFEATALEWGAMLFTAIGASIIGHGGIYYLLQRYPVTTVSPIMLLAPLLGVFFGVMIYGDTLTTRMILGGALTFIGVLVITLREPRVRAQTRAQGAD